MTVDPDAIDVNVFQKHVAVARRTSEAGRLDEAADRLLSGLSLSRGTALEGMNTPYFELRAGDQRARADTR